jgi:hypothetical protein
MKFKISLAIMGNIPSKTKDKIREVVKEFYQGLSTKEKELYNKG